MASIACVGERGGQFDDLDVEGSRWHPAHRAGKLDVPTMAILCAVSVVQGLDNQLLASSFAALERLHGYEPAVLGSLVGGPLVGGVVHMEELRLRKAEVSQQQVAKLVDQH